MATSATLAAEWQPYSRGFTAIAHGLALPTANSLHGSVIADENVLAVRSLTLPPMTQGPHDRSLRNVSRLGRLSVNGTRLADYFDGTVLRPLDMAGSILPMHALETHIDGARAAADTERAQRRALLEAVGMTEAEFLGPSSRIVRYDTAAAVDAALHHPVPGHELGPGIEEVD